jgi:hypothetical protein
MCTCCLIKLSALAQAKDPFASLSLRLGGGGGGLHARAFAAYTCASSSRWVPLLPAYLAFSPNLFLTKIDDVCFEFPPAWRNRWILKVYDAMMVARLGSRSGWVEPDLWAAGVKCRKAQLGLTVAVVLGYFSDLWYFRELSGVLASSFVSSLLCDVQVLGIGCGWDLSMLYCLYARMCFS